MCAVGEECRNYLSALQTGTITLHCKKCCWRLLMLWVPFSSPLIVASPFFGVLDWIPEDEAAVALAACCWANLSRKACCRVCTTSGMTASMSDRDSIGRPSNTVPSCQEQRQSVTTKASRCNREALACMLSPHWCWSPPPHTEALSAG